MEIGSTDLMFIFAGMYRLSIIAAFAAAVLFFAGCAKPATCNVVCFDALNLVTVGLDTNQVSVLVIKTYKASTGFSDLISTKAYYTDDGSLSWQHLNNIKGNDSLIAMHNYLVDFPDTGFVTYNYEIDIPNALKTYYLTNLSFGGASAEKQVCDGIVGCTRLANYTLNNQTYTNISTNYVVLGP